MNKIYLAFGIFLLFYVISLMEAQAQFVFSSCDRSTIEKYPEEEKQSVLFYLDTARKQTDEFMKLFAESEFDKISALNSNRKITIYVKRKSVFNGIPFSLTEFEKEYGRINSYKFHYQRMTYFISDAIKLSGDVAYTIYAVKTKKSAGDLIYLSLETNQKSSKENPVIRNIFFKEGEKEVSESTSAKCANMPYGLRVELQKQ